MVKIISKKLKKHVKGNGNFYITIHVTTIEWIFHIFPIINRYTVDKQGKLIPKDRYEKITAFSNVESAVSSLYIAEQKIREDNGQEIIKVESVQLNGKDPLQRILQKKTSNNEEEG